MSETKALLGYQGRVVQEKQRIQAVMAGKPYGLKSAWFRTKHSRRLTLDLSGTKLVAWDVVTQSVVLNLKLVSANLDQKQGLVAQLAIYDGNSSSMIVVGCDPVYIPRINAFIHVDTVDPFKAGSSGQGLNVIAHTTASPKGEWQDGVAIGYENEFAYDTL